MCYQSRYKLTAKGALGEDVKKTSKMLFRICRTLLGARMFSRAFDKY